MNLVSNTFFLSQEETVPLYMLVFSPCYTHCISLCKIDLWLTILCSLDKVLFLSPAHRLVRLCAWAAGPLPRQWSVHFVQTLSFSSGIDPAVLGVPLAFPRAPSRGEMSHLYGHPNPHAPPVPPHGTFFSMNFICLWIRIGAIDLFSVEWLFMSLSVISRRDRGRHWGAWVTPQLAPFFAS